MVYHTFDNAFCHTVGTNPSYNYKNHQIIIYTYENLFILLV